MNASSESGLWATWMVVIGESSLRSGARRGERGVDVVLVEAILGQRGRALGRFRGDEPRVERTGAGVAPFHASHACREDEPKEVRRPRRQNGVALRARERGIAAHLAEPAEVVALI